MVESARFGQHNANKIQWWDSFDEIDTKSGSHITIHSNYEFKERFSPIMLAHEFFDALPIHQFQVFLGSLNFF